MHNRNITIMIAVVVLMAVAMFGALSINTPTSAAPAAIPTPVAGTYTGGTMARVVTLYDSNVTTSTAFGGNPINVLTADRIDLQWIVDQPTSVNTTTVKLQFSNDQINWVDGATVLNANAADAADMQQYNLFGAYVRANIDATNTNTVSVKLIGVIR